MKPANRILEGSWAIVDGKKTGLAGCGYSSQCRIAWQCLRADPRLPFRATLGLDANPNPTSADDACRVFIPVAPEVAA